jgi:hypothetical protein
MMKRKSVYVFAFAFVLSINLVFAQKQLPGNLCISADEYRLYQLINTLRTVNDMPAIDLSASLSHVAHLHISDLIQNHPDTSICNLHSWSDKGEWTTCCYQAYVPNQDCMWDKPKELTPYKCRGYELAYWGSEEIIPDSLMKLWMRIPEVQDMLLNRGTYEKKKWLAAGVGIQKGYAVVWFGQVKDKLATPKICDNNSIKEEIPEKVSQKILIVNKKTGRYYLIFGSYDKLKDAEKQIKKYFKAGFNEAKIVISSDKIRVSLSDHPNLDAAKSAKAKLSNTYKDAWIIKY